MLDRQIHTSESLFIGIILAISGGFMDVYSYMGRGQVFANAQTGNIILFGIHLSQGEWDIAIQYLFPVLAFTTGISVSAFSRLKLKTRFQKLHWRQFTVFVEAIILMAVAFIPYNHNLIANSLTSLACGIQVESFKKINGNNIATTMCIGNLRSATDALCEYVESKKAIFKYRSLLYYGVIVCFLIGAIIGNELIIFYGLKSILVCSVLLFLAFIFMFSNKRDYTINRLLE